MVLGPSRNTGDMEHLAVTWYDENTTHHTILAPILDDMLIWRANFSRLHPLDLCIIYIDTIGTLHTQRYRVYPLFSFQLATKS